MLKPFMSASLINKVKDIPKKIQFYNCLSSQDLFLLQIIIKSASKTSDFIKTLPQTIVPKDYGGLAPIMKETNGKFRFFKF